MELQFVIQLIVAFLQNEPGNDSALKNLVRHNYEKYSNA